jgi:TIR domain
VHHVFVSYRRSDGDWVRDLVERLRQQHVAVWIDQKDIPVTVPWLSEISDAIEEAALFLRCDSPAFRTSDRCSAEVGIAEQLAKPQFVATVGSDVSDCAAAIVQATREIGHPRARRTELRVLARDWDRAGRSRGLLVGQVQRRRLASALDVPPSPTETERSFLRASRNRTLTRALVSVVAVTLIAASTITIGVLQNARSNVSNENSLLATTYSQEQAGLSMVDQDPYSGLQAAAGDGTDDQIDAHAAVITQALEQPVPDNAFTVPGARLFTVRPVGAEVLVTSTSGREWRHSSASAEAGQPAAELPVSSTTPIALPARGSVPVAFGADGLSARGSPRSGMVRVLRRGQLWRMIDFGAVTGALAFSPDGRFLAATIGEEVELADVATAQIRTQLRGATGALLDVAWNVGGTSIWALDDGRVFSWSTGSAVTLVDQPTASFNSVLPATSAGDVWIVGTHTLTKITVATGKALRTITLPDTLDSAGAAPDGSLALVSGQQYLWVVPLSRTARPRHVNLPRCALGRPTFASDTVAYLPCVGGPLLRLALPSATVTAVIQGSSAGIFSATAVPGTATVYAGDQAGHLYVVQGSALLLIQVSECDIDVQHIAVAPGDQAVLPVGAGSGQGTCTVVGLRTTGNPADPQRWTWNHLLEPQQQSVFASAVAFSAEGGSFAIGYSNGTITMHPTVNVNPILVDNSADGMIRDMLTLPDGDLIAVTDTGMVQRLQLCNSCISNAALAQVAATRLKLAERLGLVVVNRVPISQLPFGLPN